MMRNEEKGYVALIAAVMLPVVMSFFYYMVKNYHFSYDRTAFEQAVTTAATTAARYYIDQLNFANHSDYIKRKATVAFNNALKMQTSIKQNVLPVKDQVLEYSKKEVGSLYSIGSTVANSSATPNYYDRYGFFKGNIYAKTGVDPDVDSITGFMADGVYGYVIYRAFNGQAFPNISDSDSRKYTDDDVLRIAVGGSSPSSSNPNVKKTIVAVDGKGTSKSGASLNIAYNDDDSLKVEAAYRLNGKNYKKEVIAHAPILKADIVFGIPTNFAACTETNNASNSLGNCNKSPIYEIGQTLHEAIKDMLSYRECAMGVIPYSGKVSLPGVVSTKSHGTYKYSDYPAVNPTIPIAESYRFICDEAGGTLNGTSNSLGHITGLMIRSDMIKSSRKSEKYYVEDQIDSSKFLECVTNSTKFMTYPLHISYGGYSNIMAGYSRKRMTNYPNPYPMLGLTEDKLKIYRYLTTLFPYNESTNKSSMGYLPVMFGMSMLDDGTLFNADIYSGSSDRKKALILIANQDDTFEKNDLTYLGFSNDGSHISMIDGDLLDLEKDKYLKQVDGYYCSPDAYQYEDSRIDTDKYRKNTMIKTTYDPKGEDAEESCLIIPEYVEYYDKYVNQHIVVSLKNGDGKVVYRSDPNNAQGGKYYCYIDAAKQASFSIEHEVHKRATGACHMTPDGKGFCPPRIYNFSSVNGEIQKCNVYSYNNVTVSSSGNTITFTPSSPLENQSEQTYEITLKSTVKVDEKCDIILPKPGNTKIVLWNDVAAVLKIFPDVGQHGEITVDEVTADDEKKGKVYKEDNMIYCSILGKSSETKFKVKVTKKDSSSPVVLKTELQECEYTKVESTKPVYAIPCVGPCSGYTPTFTGTVPCFRQDENYVYVCDSNGVERTYEFELTVKAINGSSYMTQHDTLSYVDEQLVGTGTEMNNIHNYSGFRYNKYNRTVTVYNACRMSSVYNVTLDITHSFPSHGKNRLYSGESQGHWHYFIGSYCSESFNTYSNYKRFYRNLKGLAKDTAHMSRCYKTCTNESHCRCDCGVSSYSRCKYTPVLDVAYGNHFRGHEGHIHCNEWAEACLFGKCVNVYCKDLTIGEYYDHTTTEPCKIDSHQMGEYQYNHIRYIDITMRQHWFADSISYSDRKNDIIILIDHTCAGGALPDCYQRLFVGEQSTVESRFVDEISGSKSIDMNSTLQSIKCSKINTKTRYWKTRSCPLKFSGDYIKTYNNSSYGYNVVYIPRDKIRASGSDDSASISVDLTGFKLISIEWSNHLNGTEGCYSCSTSDGNDAKLSNGNSAVYYEQIQPTKNAMFVSFMNTGGNLNYFSGIQNETFSYTTDPTARLEDLLNIYNISSYWSQLRVTVSGVSADEPQDFSFVSNDRQRTHSRWHDNSGVYQAKSYTPCESVIHSVMRYYWQKKKGENPYMYTNGFGSNSKTPMFSYRSLEATNNINRVLEACGYHGAKSSNNGYPKNAKEAIKQATKAAIKKFNEKFGKKGRIYVIKYRWSDADKNKDDTYADVYKSYIVDAPTKAGELTTTQRLHKALRLILTDIERWANITSAKIVEKSGKA